MTTQDEMNGKTYCKPQFVRLDVDSIEQLIAALLNQVDIYERMIRREPRTAEMRKWYKDYYSGKIRVGG